MHTVGKVMINSSCMAVCFVMWVKFVSGRREISWEQIMVIIMVVMSVVHARVKITFVMSIGCLLDLELLQVASDVDLFEGG